MPFTIRFSKLPVGYAASTAKATDDTVSVQFTGFSSTEDGQRFVKLLEGLPNDVLELLKKQCTMSILPSQVDHLLVVVNRDHTATVYLNELQLRVKARASREIKVGEPVMKNDIMDIDRLELGNVAIPAEAGVLYLFSVGWRKGLFYDFAPLRPEAENDQSFDCPTILGQVYAYVLFQERFSILESEWDSLFRGKLFPFAGLLGTTIEKMLTHVRNGWDLNELSGSIVTEVRRNLPAFLRSWHRHPAFTPHIGVLECAAQRFEDEDWMSSVSLLLPRIEGVLRTHHINIGRTGNASQKNLVKSAAESIAATGRWLLLPDMFRKYLDRIYFAGFSSNVQPCDPGISVSRNSIAHGVAPPNALSAFEAAISFLVLHQLFCGLDHFSP